MFGKPEGALQTNHQLKVRTPGVHGDIVEAAGTAGEDARISY
jgi:hypothetical protein